ncbi:hypothetical protein BU17DRAFT_91514 [Hysterangium stoloniferum]|nr:hypothetical protein BU17DRAFT_91514 [Hysterangium stoloniferum]
MQEETEFFQMQSFDASTFNTTASMSQRDVFHLYTVPLDAPASISQREASHLHTIPPMHQLEPSPLMPLKGPTIMSQMEASHSRDTYFHPGINTAPSNIQVEFSPRSSPPSLRSSCPHFDRGALSPRRAYSLQTHSSPEQPSNYWDRNDAVFMPPFDHANTVRLLERCFPDTCSLCGNGKNVQ